MNTNPLFHPRTSVTWLCPNCGHRNEEHFPGCDDVPLDKLNYYCINCNPMDEDEDITGEYATTYLELMLTPPYVRDKAYTQWLRAFLRDDVYTVAVPRIVYMDGQYYVTPNETYSQLSEKHDLFGTSSMLTGPFFYRSEAERELYRECEAIEAAHAREIAG